MVVDEATAPAGDTVLVTTYLGVPDEGELTTPVDEAGARAFDDQCDIETPSPQ